MYEFYPRRTRARINRPMYGLGALGFSESWKVPMSTQVVRAPSCPNVTGGRSICAAPSEQEYMSNQGCRSTAYRGLSACITASGVNGDLWCCPPGRPGTSASPPVAQPGVTRDNIIALQNWINQQGGCSAGRADGVYGPNTARGLQCAIAATSYVNVTGRFPFVSTLLADPTGTPRPESFTFDPGTTAKTPEQVGVRPTVAVGPAAEEEPGAPSAPPEEASMFGQIFGALPWWGWLGIAGGVGLLAVIGVAVMKSGEGEEEAAPEERSLGSIEEYGL